MVAHLRRANLRDILVRAKLPPVDRSRVQVRKHVQASKSVERPDVCVAFIQPTQIHTQAP